MPSNNGFERVEFAAVRSDFEVRAPQTVADVFNNECDNGTVPSEFVKSALNDVRVKDAFSHGWCVFAPSEFAVNPEAKHLTVVPECASQFVSIVESSSDQVQGFIDTLLEVRVPEGVEVTVVPPLFFMDFPIHPVTVSTTEDMVPLRLPFTTDSRFSVREGMPLAQILPFSVTDFSVTSGTACGPLSPDMQRILEKVTGMNKVYGDPYSDRIRKEK